MWSILGKYSVASLSDLAIIIQRFDLDAQTENLVLCIKDKEVDVKVLGNGYIELDGEVPTIAKEREFDEAIKQYGAYVKEASDPAAFPVYRMAA